MEIHEIPTTTTPRKAMASLIHSSKTNDANQFSPPTFSSTFSESNSRMQEVIVNAETIISKWDPSRPSVERFTSLFQENREEAGVFAKCVDDLRRAMHFLVSQHSGSTQLVLANKLMKIAMLRLEKEFYHILSTKRECLNPESVSGGSSLSLSNSDEEEDDDHVDSDGDARLSNVERALLDLKLIAGSMISSGYSKECSEIYRITRKSIVDEELYRLGIRGYTVSQINRMDPEALEHQVKKWVSTAKVAVRTLFRGERLLCDHVFSVSETIKQTCIAHTTTEGAVNLFRFPETVAKSKRSPEKIFLVMNLFETLSELWPEIESIFSYEPLSPIKLQALSSMHKLSNAARTILSEFVSSIQKNSSKTPIPGGGIHPLNCSVMNYVSLLAENSGILSNILADESETVAPSPFPESYFDSPSSTSGVASQLAWIILVLLCKLDSKAEIYRDIGLSYLFLANNLQLVVEKVSTSALKLLLGQDWLSKLQTKVKLYAANYESVAWAKVLSSLPVETEESADKIRQHFTQFNSAFEAAYRKQSSWVVPDPKLRDEIKVSIARKLVPAYREFYDSNLAILSGEKNLEILVRFSPDNLGNYLSDLFASTVVISVDDSSSLSSSSSQSGLLRCL
ncbi:Exocyst complex component EXO70H1 [Sesamum alatum]|uniref:Exocyst subunit Exo70 family protein n=1 Tax=Sesamum alatum TaxID=300844 RepID=A0AAE2CK74_9LAMI|nr:Exocyst complex component EXO70H1 [Sesamum alatum]